MKNGKSSHDPGPLPQSATYCRHCNMAFPVSVPIVGEPPDARFVRLTAQLADHMMKKHQDKFKQDYSIQMNMSIAYSAQIVLENFNSTDEALMSWRDRERHKMFRAMMRATVSDEKIEHKVEELLEVLFDDPKSAIEDETRDATRKAFVAFVKSMRDAIEERNLYPEPAHLLISVV